jgi:ABC-2 type transport system ATP-binding protein
MVINSMSDITPDAKQWVVETFALEKNFAVRHGLPVGMGWGTGHWLTSTLLKYSAKVKRFNAVNKVDLKVRRGEMLGLLGPNGAGKTTLIKCLAALLQIDGGVAFVNGFNVATHPDEARLSMNLVGSGHWVAFDWSMSIVQNLHFFGSLYGLDKAQRNERIQYTLHLLNLEPLARQTPSKLSSGERQRMLLAKGFMVRTPLFLLDEPTVGLDPAGARDVREFIRKQLIGKSNMSGLLTTHRLAEAEALCSRIAIMNQGSLIAAGTPLELKRLANQYSVLEVRARTIPLATVETIKQMSGIKKAAVAAVGEQVVEESLRVHCEDAEAVMGPIVDLLRRQGAEVTYVEPQEPTLEDAFIALTARRLN